MFLLLLFLTLTPTNALECQTPRANPPTPADVQVLSFYLGQSPQTRLDLERPLHGGSRSSGLDRTNDGDRARNTTDNVRMGGIGTGSIEASQSVDPIVTFPGPDSIFGNDPSPGRIVSEKTLTATVVIRNDGTKTIKAIDWDFPFPHILNKKPELRYAIHSKVRIKPGETITIRGPISKSAKGFNISQGNGPAHSVTLTSTQEGISITVPVASLRGGVQIIRTKYSDGSAWQRP